MMNKNDLMQSVILQTNLEFWARRYSFTKLHKICSS